jgi:hypothetical protein
LIALTVKSGSSSSAWMEVACSASALVQAADASHFTNGRREGQERCPFK